MWAALQTGNNTQHLWTLTAELGIVFLTITGLVVLLMRRFFQSTRGSSTGPPPAGIL